MNHTISSKELMQIIIPCIFGIIGLIILLNSVDMGIDSAGQYLRKAAGGSMDSNQYRQIEENYTETYRLLGGIILFLGCAFFLYRFNIEKLIEKTNDSDLEQIDTK